MPHPLLTTSPDGPLWGGWSSLASPGAVGSLARSGFDWVVLDMQHGEHDHRSVRDCLRGIRSSDVPVLVRPGACDTEQIGQALDAGAAGVIVPMVSTPEQARTAARACRYAPAGNRSWGPHALDAGLPAPGPAEANEAVLCAVMVETREGLANLAQIAAVDGVDVVFVGPFDLALELGTDVQALLAADGPDDPLPTIVRTCAEQGVVVGAFGAGLARSARFRELGFRFIAAATDATLLQGATREWLSRLNDGTPQN